jgi:hypothetical protein
MKLRAVDTPLDPDRANVVTLHAPGRQRSTEHPLLGPLPKAMNWMSEVRRLMREPPGMSLYEADRIVTEGMSTSHDGKGRRFQPSGQR